MPVQPGGGAQATLPAPESARGLLPGGREILTSSDAHCLENVAAHLHCLSPQSVLRRLLPPPPAE